MKIVFQIIFLFGFSFQMRSQEVIKVKKENQPTVYTIVDKSAEFPDGLPAMYHFISSNLKFPMSCINDTSFNERCTVYVKYVVDETGKVGNIQILKGCKCEEFNKEAVRVISMMPAWNPAITRNKAVKSNQQIPISFRMQ